MRYIDSVSLLVLTVKELVHLSDFHVFHGLAAILFRLNRSLLKGVGKLERNDTTTFITDKHNRVNVVESDVESLCALGSSLIAQVSVFLLVKIVDVKTAF
jgi:hypothetical protein